MNSLAQPLIRAFLLLNVAIVAATAQQAIPPPSDGTGTSQSQLTSRRFYAVENLQTGEVMRRGLVPPTGLPQGSLILGPNTAYRYWEFELISGRVGSVEFRTGNAGQRFRIPVVPLIVPRTPDTDRDGLSNEAEFILGTDPTKADTDGDGIKDGAALGLGIDPSVAGRTGVFGVVDTPGTGLDVFASNDLVTLADGPAGVAVFNVFNRMVPVRVAQVGTPGEARAVGAADNFILVADGAVGLAVIDIADPASARIVRQVAVGGTVQAVLGLPGLAVVGTLEGTFVLDGSVVFVDLETGAIRQTLDLGGSVEDLAVEGVTLYAYTPNRLHVITPSGGAWAVAGSVALPGSLLKNLTRGRLQVLNGIAYTAHSQGYHTIDVRDPAAPRLLMAGVEPGSFWWQIVPTRSGLAVGVASLSTFFGPLPGKVRLYNLTNTTTFGSFQTEFAAPERARAVALYNGMAYVADSTNGLQVLNYRAADVRGQPPAVSVAASFTLTTPTNGVALAGRLAALTAHVTDDVQARNVEFYVDGRKVFTDGNEPFEYRFVPVSPAAGGSSLLRLQARASDTGGNAVWSETIELSVVAADNVPPAVLGFTGADTAIFGHLAEFTVTFSEPIAQSTWNTKAIQVIEAGQDGSWGTADDVSVTLRSVAYDSAALRGTVAFDATLPVGNYRATVRPSVTDLVQNALPAAAVWHFRVLGRDFGPDRDHDGVPDDREARLGLDPDLPDTNHNGVLDGHEDPDADGVPTWDELARGLDPLDADTDHDGTLDGVELQSGCNPLLAETTTVSGRILDSKGSPVAGARIAATPGATAPVATDADGRFQIRGVPACLPVRVLAVTTNAMGVVRRTSDPLSPVKDGNTAAGDLVLVSALADLYPGFKFPLGSNPNRDHGPGVLMDADRDGLLDLATPMSLLTGNGDGTFKDPRDIDLGLAFRNLVAADFNLDGLPDLATTTGSGPGSYKVNIALGRGDGTFQAPRSFPSGDYSMDLQVAEIDGNQSPDLLSFNSFGTNVWLLRGLGDGGLQPYTSLRPTIFTGGLAVGRFNNDNTPDFALVDNAGHIVVYFGNGDGSFNLGPALNIGTNAIGAYPIGAADVTGDGRDDLFAANSRGLDVALFAGRGDGTFQSERRLALGLGAIPEIPNRKYLDKIQAVRLVAGQPSSLVVSAPFYGLTILTPDGAGGFRPPVLIPTGDYTTLTTLAGDLNRDGNTDLLAVGAWYGFAFPADGRGGFIHPQRRPIATSVYDTRLADCNGDGRLDIVAAVDDATGSNPQVAVLIQDPAGNFQTPRLSPAPASPWGNFIAVGDLNGDGFADLASLGDLDDTIAVLLGTGNGSFGEPRLYPVGTRPSAVRSADFNGDGRPDLVVANEWDDSVSVLLGTGAGQFSDQHVFALASDPAGLAPADLNGDGRIDIVVVNAEDIEVLIGNGDGTFQPARAIPTGLSYSAPGLAVADFNRDGKLDVATHDNDAYALTLRLGNGDGTFQAAQVWGNRVTWVVDIQTADVNGDGFLDLVATDYDNRDIVVLVGDGTGAFPNQVRFAAGGYNTTVAIADLNGDGSPDLVTQSESHGEVVFLYHR